PAEGEELQIYFLRKNGVFHFTTRVKKAFDNILALEHSEEIARIQRRKFYRGRVSLPVSVKKKESSEPAVRTYILELGGGGLTLFNPYKVFHPGDGLGMIFTLPDSGDLRVQGRVRRTDRGGSLAHVEFESIKESVRDKILGFVLNRAMGSG
ncbi:MAG: PilZ domain-containing protein, partial [Spirochaetales bacterium]|nr:PilZ domain-containing protein [Spirochaetales bacterium]